MVESASGEGAAFVTPDAFGTQVATNGQASLGAAGVANEANSVVMDPVGFGFRHISPLGGPCDHN